MLEKLLVLGLQQGVTRAGFGQDEQRHGGRPRLRSWKNKNSASIIISPGQKAKERLKEGVDRGRFNREGGGI